mmetsp:Transcript_8242/g.34611  ORF Transcript_8242/g.34611 Transcript_8242/m.34611 type:complete len:224 (+) Transcript_8242:577-1248(+)
MQRRHAVAGSREYSTLFEEMLDGLVVASLGSKQEGGLAGVVLLIHVRAALEEEIEHLGVDGRGGGSEEGSGALVVPGSERLALVVELNELLDEGKVRDEAGAVDGQHAGAACVKDVVLVMRNEHLHCVEVAHERCAHQRRPPLLVGYLRVRTVVEEVLDDVVVPSRRRRVQGCLSLVVLVVDGLLDVRVRLNQPLHLISLRVCAGHNEPLRLVLVQLRLIEIL